MLQDLVHQLAGKRILVIGDIILDEYLIGKATRMSREAPIPVLEFESRQLLPGGAANPSANITRLNATAIQVGAVGSDDAGQNLVNILVEQGIDTSQIIIDPDRPTTVKTRILAQMGLRFPQQVARMDRLSRNPIDIDLENKILHSIQLASEHIDAILISDYHVGMLTASLIAGIRATASHIPLSVDAQGELAKYKGCSLVKCNADDAQIYLNRQMHSNDEFGIAAMELFTELELTGAMVITRGAEGATIAEVGGQITHCPAPKIADVFDTVGAGDTAIAVMALAKAAGATYAEAVTLANYASGLVVQRVGNYCPSPDELIAALNGKYKLHEKPT